MSSLVKIDKTNIPSHVAIIMDGNGRWAKNKGEERIFGHTYGVESVREVLKAAKEIGVKYLTLYAFSAENWNRPKSELEGLMDLLVQSITGELDEMNNNGVRLLSVGNTNQLPKKCRESLFDAQLKTKDNSDLNLVLALNYSAREDIIDGVKKISNKVKVPHMGWNNISNLKSQLFNNVIDNEFMYLVHSFYVPIIPETIAESNYNGFFSVAIQKNNFYGVQFHPEKSSKPGIKILENFLTI